MWESYLQISLKLNHPWRQQLLIKIQLGANVFSILYGLPSGWGAEKLAALELGRVLKIRTLKPLRERCGALQVILTITRTFKQNTMLLHFPEPGKSPILPHFLEEVLARKQQMLQDTVLWSFHFWKKASCIERKSVYLSPTIFYLVVDFLLIHLSAYQE